MQRPLICRQLDCGIELPSAHVSSLGSALMAQHGRLDAIGRGAYGLGALASLAAGLSAQPLTH